VPLAFAVTVTSRDWDASLNAWRCPALRIPGATIDAVFDRGLRVDPSWYESLPEHGLLRWVRSADAPSEATVFLNLTQELSTEDLTAKWKKLAIVLPFAASLIAAIISGTVTYLSVPKSAEASKEHPAKPKVQESAPLRARCPGESRDDLLKTACDLNVNLNGDAWMDTYRITDSDVTMFLGRPPGEALSKGTTVLTFENKGLYDGYCANVEGHDLVFTGDKWKFVYRSLGSGLLDKDRIKVLLH
jgi:hypothetical protein